MPAVLPLLVRACLAAALLVDAPASSASPPEPTPSSPADAPTAAATAPSSDPVEAPTTEPRKAVEGPARPPRAGHENAPKTLLAVGVVSLATAIAASLVGIDAAVDEGDIERRLARADDPEHPEDALGEGERRTLENRLERERKTVLGGSIAAAGLGAVGIALLVSGLVLRHRRVAPFARVSASGGTIGASGRF